MKEYVFTENEVKLIESALTEGNKALERIIAEKKAKQGPTLGPDYLGEKMRTWWGLKDYGHDRVSQYRKDIADYLDGLIGVCHQNPNNYELGRHDGGQIMLKMIRKALCGEKK